MKKLIFLRFIELQHNLFKLYKIVYNMTTRINSWRSVHLA